MTDANFTGHGAIQAANVLASAEAVDMGMYVAHAFVRLCERSAYDPIRDVREIA
jgi:hypothetical protein